MGTETAPLATSSFPFERATFPSLSTSTVASPPSALYVPEFISRVTPCFKVPLSTGVSPVSLVVMTIVWPDLAALSASATVAYSPTVEPSDPFTVAWALFGSRSLRIVARSTSTFAFGVPSIIIVPRIRNTSRPLSFSASLIASACLSVTSA